MIIIHYQDNGYFDYAHYWSSNAINCFIGRCKTGKTYSLAKAGIHNSEYDFIGNSFVLSGSKNIIEV